tara:strand:- start:431 stop:757 length:327 start_codon:yes stop_codon:yes gene_type:complete
VAKCTKREKQIRLNKIYAMKREGKSRIQILEYASKNWGIKRAQTDNLIKEVMDEMMIEFKRDRVSMTVEIADQLTAVIERSAATNQHAVTLGAINAKAKLFNLTELSK